MTHVIQLDSYCARADGVRGRLVLGTWASYGIEQLQLVLGDGWEGRTVTAVFNGPKTSAGTTVLAGSDGLVDVPQEATAAAGYGTITIVGVDADSQRISVDVPYMVMVHAPVTGQAPDPTPDIWQQFIAQVKADADRAEQAAGDAADSAAAAAKSAEAAAESAKQAEQAGADIGAAKDVALEAIQQAQDTGVQAVQTATTTGVQAVQQAHQAALDDIATNRRQALADIEDAGYKQTAAITSGGAAALEAIGQTEQAAIGQVQQSGQAQLDKINSTNALVPTPTQADAGKAVVVKADGNGYQLGEVKTDSYTKAESDARYAPIEAAIRPTVSGNPATLEHSVAWAMQGLSVYGKSTQDGTPSPDNSVPIQSAGASGSIETTITGKNLLTGRLYYGRYNVGIATIDNKNEVSLPYKPTAESQGICQTVSVKKGVTYSFSVTNPNTNARLFLALYRTFEDAFNNINSISHIEDAPVASITASEDGILVCLIAGKYTDGSTTIHECTASELLQLEIGSTATAYEAPHSQSIVAATPNGLPGIPVDSGGNYTDAEGQQWVCDEVDFERGVYVQRIGAAVLNGRETWVLSATSKEDIFRYCIYHSNLDKVFETSAKSNVAAIGMCETLLFASADDTYTKSLDIISVGANGNEDLLYIFAEKFKVGDVEAFKTWLSSNPQTLHMILKEPIETPLSEEELAAYAALRSYNGTTIVSTDAPVAGLSARYVADGAAYIDSKLQAIAAQQLHLMIGGIGT